MGKKILISLILFVLIVAAAFGYRWYEQSKATPETPTPAAPTFPGGTPRTPTQPNQTTLPPDETFGGTTTIAIPPTQELSAAIRSSLEQISKNAVSGYAVIATTSKTSVVRFIERESGNTFEYRTASGTTERLTNTTIPKIQKAFWGKDGRTVILSYLGENRIPQTFLGVLPSLKGTSTEKLDGSFFADATEQIARVPSVGSKDPGTFAYLVKTNTGAEVRISDFTQKTRTILKTPAREWNLSWPETNTVALNTAPSALSPGFLYSFDIRQAKNPPSDSAITKVLGGLPGFNGILSPDLAKVFYNITKEGTVRSGIFNRKTQTHTALGIQTLAEKCTWGDPKTHALYCAVPLTLPEATYPDDWYQGNISFSDVFWKIDTDTGSLTFLLFPKPIVGYGVDAIDLRLDATATHLFFINKQDQSLWSINLALLQ